MVELELRIACAARGPAGNQFNACASGFLRQSDDSAGIISGRPVAVTVASSLQVNGNSGVSSGSCSSSSSTSSASSSAILACGERASKRRRRMRHEEQGHFKQMITSRERMNAMLTCQPYAGSFSGILWNGQGIFASKLSRQEAKWQYI